MGKLMYSCKEATETVIRKEEEKLDFSSALKLRMHLMMCGACRLFEKHSMFLNHILSNPHFIKKLPDDYKEELQKKIEKKM